MPLHLATEPTEPPFALALLRLVQLLRRARRIPLERALREAAFGLRVDRSAFHHFAHTHAAELRAAALGVRNQRLLARPSLG